jgi:hypothetical protein
VFWRLLGGGGVKWHQLTRHIEYQFCITAVEIFDCHFYFVINGGKGKILILNGKIIY